MSLRGIALSATAGAMLHLGGAAMLPSQDASPTAVAPGQISLAEQSFAALAGPALAPVPLSSAADRLEPLESSAPAREPPAANARRVQPTETRARTNEAAALSPPPDQPLAPSADAPRTSPRPASRPQPQPQSDRAREVAPTTPATDSRASVPPPSELAQAADYKRRVLEMIARQPRRPVGEDGRTLIALEIAASGRIAGVRIRQSSGSAYLDRVAVEHVRRAGPFPSTPGGRPLSMTVAVESLG